MGIDRKIFLTTVRQEAIDVLNKMPDYYGLVMQNTKGDNWAVQVLQGQRGLLSHDELNKLVVFPNDFYTESE